MNIFELLDLKDAEQLKKSAELINSIGSQIQLYDADALVSTEQPNLIFIGVPVDETDKSIYCIRKSLYNLFFADSNLQFADAGNFIGSPLDLSRIVQRFLSLGCIPVIFGADQSMTYYMYKAFCDNDQTINILSVDERPDLGDPEESLSNSNWLSHILAHTPNYLFNYSLLGHQTYISHPEYLKALSSLNFDLFRLGEIRKDLQRTEPYFRNTDLLSFDVSSIRSSDATGTQNEGPNGLYAEEACQLARYSGMSNKMTAVGVFGWSTSSGSLPTNLHMLVAQIIWHFIDGIKNRIADGQIGNELDYTIYNLSPPGEIPDLVFYKNNRNSRWWMSVPMGNPKNRFKRHQLIPCSYEDYKQAMQGDIPDTWWRTYQKLI